MLIYSMLYLLVGVFVFLYFEYRKTTISPEKWARIEKKREEVLVVFEENGFNKKWAGIVKTGLVLLLWPWWISLMIYHKIRKSIY